MNEKENSLLFLIEKNGDTYEELQIKNRKLRDIIIKINEELKSVNLKYNSMVKEFTTEKQMLLEKLDQITKNYKLYAEGYQEKSLLKKDIGTLINNYKQNNKVMKSFKDAFSFILKKNIMIYNDCKQYYSKKSKNLNNNQNIEFIEQIQSQLFNSLIKFKKNIDMINFPDFYKEYLTFIETEEESRRLRDTNKNNEFMSIDKNSSRNKTNQTNYTNDNINFGKRKNNYSFTKIDLSSKKNQNKNYINRTNNNIYDNEKFKNENKYSNKSNDNIKYKNNNCFRETNYYKSYIYP